MNIFEKEPGDGKTTMQFGLLHSDVLYILQM